MNQRIRDGRPRKSWQSTLDRSECHLLWHKQNFCIQLFSSRFYDVISQVSYLMSSYHIPNVLFRYSDTAVFCSSICS